MGRLTKIQRRRVCIASFGTWGDVLPYARLAENLHSEGLDVFLLVDRQFQARITKVNTRPLCSSDPVAVERLKALACKKFDLTVSAQAFVSHWFLSRRSEILRELQGFVKPEDILVAGCHLVSVLNLLEHDPARLVLGVHFPLTASEWQRLTGFNYLYAVSPGIFPIPNEQRKLCLSDGFWRAKKSSDKLLNEYFRWCNEGAAPILVTSGSFSPWDAHQWRSLLIRWSARSGRRLVCQGHWADSLKGILGDRKVFTFSYLPLELLSRGIEYAIHHGGIGTALEILAAKKPSIFFPQLGGDQVNTASQFGFEGLSVGTIYDCKINDDEISSLHLRATRDKRLRQKIARASSRVVAENGLQFASAAIQRLVLSGARA